nr:MAG TPA: hypothetical protein [Bacteriophage sp.]
MNLIIIQLTYTQSRILNLCLILAFIIGIFAVYGYIEDKKEKHAQAEAKACERKRRQLQQAIEQKQFDELYKTVMLDDILKQTRYEYSLCQLCNNKNSKEHHCNDVKEVFVDDLGNVVGCSKFCSGVRAKK